MLLEIVREIKDTDYSVYLGCDHNFEGLAETNIFMLNCGGNIYDNYTGESLSLTGAN